MALNVCTLGIPCIYYGTEQLFDGQGGNDRYIRESMFGGAFGAFRSKDRHFFKEEQFVYQEFAKIAKVRSDLPALSRGRQYLREISGDGVNFGVPTKLGDRLRSVVPWSRIYNDVEVLVAINTDACDDRTAWVTADSSLNASRKSMRCLYSTNSRQIGTEIPVEPRNGRAVQLTVPAAGLAGGGKFTLRVHGQRDLVARQLRRYLPGPRQRAAWQSPRGDQTKL